MILAKRWFKMNFYVKKRKVIQGWTYVHRNLDVFGFSYMSGPMGKPPLWKSCKFSDKRRILYRTAEKFLISKIMHHTIKKQYSSNCIPFSKFC